MNLQQVSDSCFAVTHDRNRACDANSGLINLGGGVAIDTQPDLAHARRAIELFGKVLPRMPRRVINTNEDGDHVWGNQLFESAEIIAHRSVPDRMRRVADPDEMRNLQARVERLLPRLALRIAHPGLHAHASRRQERYDLTGVRLVFPTTVFDERHVLDLDGTEVHLIHVGPCHRIGDTLVHLPKERVLFAGDVVFRMCTPMGWAGTHAKWLEALDLVVWLDPDVIVPGHGPLCGVEGAMELKAYLEYTREESRRYFDRGLTAAEASARIDFGPYGSWHCAARIYANVECAYREFREERAGAPMEAAHTLDGVYGVAKARGLEAEP